MKRLIKPLVFVLLMVGLLWFFSKNASVLLGWAQQLWGFDDAKLDKINKWTGILADGGTVVAVAIGTLWALSAWFWQSERRCSPTLRQAYLRYIDESYKYLDFKGIEKITEAVKNSSGLRLEAVYVPLRARLDLPSGESWYRLGGRFFCGTKAHAGDDVPSEVEQAAERAEQDAILIEKWLEQSPALVILGDPGSGKSTSLKHIALINANAKHNILPILLPLNAYSAALDKNLISLEEFLPEYFHSKRPTLDAAGLKLLFQQVLSEQKAFVLLDGLDEVGSNRGQVVQQVEQFVRTWIPDPHTKQTTANRVVVTSRFVGYRDFPLADVRWKTVAINDWNVQEIEQFYSKFTLAAELAWSGGEDHSLARQKAAAECQALMAVVGDANNKGIRRLAGNPLLSSLLALIKRQGVNLPDRRVKLYELYMDTLLRSWNRSRNLDGTPIGVVEEDAAVYALLAKLALHLRETNPQQGLIAEDAMQHYLRQHYQADNYARADADRMASAFLKSVHEHSNLLIERGYQQYGFIHLTFEEYLAGFALAKEDVASLQAKIPTYLQQAKQWKETLLLAMGVIAVLKTEREKANQILQFLLDTQQTECGLFVGEVLMDVGASQLGKRMTDAIKAYLIQLMQNPQADILARAKAGRILSEVGDPRQGVTIKRHNNGEPMYAERKGKCHTLPDIDWVKIPADSFLMGTVGEEGYNNEKPAHTVHLPEFYLSRSPITNAQYRCFLEAGLYEDKAFWYEKLPTAASQWLGGAFVGEILMATIVEEVREKYRAWLKEDTARQQPRFWLDKKWSYDNHPVVGVSWFEALAYSVWLNELGASIKPEGLVASPIRLPAEEEWEYAARGSEAWAYAWGNEADPHKGNYSDAGIGQTSSVGLFPPSLAFGLQDMSGNVWEWTSSRWGKNANSPDFTYTHWQEQQAQRNLLKPVEFRTLRGGSGYDGSEFVRCAVREGDHPTYRNVHVGFRVLLNAP